MTKKTGCPLPESSANPKTIVCIVDDDVSVRKSLANLLRSAGYQSRVFVSGEEFLSLDSFDDVACLLLDLRMNGLSGIEVMQALALMHRKFPVICMSAHWDEATLAESSRYDAIECLRKPFSSDALLSAVELALHVKG
ncbi:response regulator transcription factor [Pseudomonas frederiksbergensis]|uniref:Two-component system response regulator n=1 Tax=Pseudomonas frederiksbergensis TaxID=104087 RepID=A0A423HP68_9PSED|nr:response regulator [Pseudomonas frederiksbergensis]RON14962.1 two-component system response regulator [Pseudomonas frederiksbergensis]